MQVQKLFSSIVNKQHLFSENKKKAALLRQPLNILQIEHYLFRVNGIVQFIINKNPSAVFANYYFFSLLNFTLFLRWNGIKTTPAGISSNRNHCQAVAIIFPDPVITNQQPLFNLCSCSSS